MPGIMEFESKQEKYVFFSIIAILLIISSIMAAPIVKAYFSSKMNAGGIITGASIAPAVPVSPREYYAMFKCSCCGETIDKGCCGMANQRKAFLDKLLEQSIDEKEILYRMVKEFGFDILMDPSKEQGIKDYIQSKAPDEPPRITIDKSKFDFGTISQSAGNATATFEIRNTGKSDLVIDKLDTSCMCTSASIIYKGIEGPRFGMSMHSTNPENFEIAIPPGESAQLKVYYDPMAHGKQKERELKIIREITITSNDPSDFQKNVRIELIQVP